jgi:predicted phage terminase large subunit-like protein
MPPRSGKSELGSRNFPPWVLGQHPDWEIIATSHTQSLTLSFSRYVRDLVRDPAYKAIFPDLTLDPVSQSIENWNTLQGGGYLAAGLGSGISGRGCHILVVDDVVKDAESASSSTIRENTWEWYISTAYTRIAPGGGVLGILTWWHEDDWAGRIQEVMKSGEGDVFEVVKYPAINEEGDEYILPDDTIQQFAPESDPPPEGSRLTRLRGTAIHPARYTTAMMLKIKNNLISSGLKRVWNALYQQNPVPDDGAYFTKEMLRWYTHPPRREDMFVYQAWDFAITEKTDSDWTVCCTIGQDEADNLYVLHILRFRSGDGNAIVDDILDQVELFKPDLIGFEDGQIWKSLSSQFTKRCEERRLYPSFETLQPLTDKKVRASPLKGRMQNGKLFIRQHQPWTEPFRQELMKFPSGTYLDQVDAAAWAVRLTLTKSAPKKRVPPAQKSWRDNLKALLGERGATHMSA